MTDKETNVDNFYDALAKVDKKTFKEHLIDAIPFFIIGGVAGFIITYIIRHLN